MKLDVVTFKQLLGISVDNREKDFVLQFVLDDVENAILTYCNINAIPDRLKHLAYRMAIDLYRAEGIGSEELEKGVSSITEGGASVHFSSTSYDNNFTNSIIKKYEHNLKEYRRLRW